MIYGHIFENMGFFLIQMQALLQLVFDKWVVLKLSQFFQNLSKIHLNLISQALGILQDDSYKKISEELESKIQTLILKRTEAKDNKDYDLADKIRNELLDLGVEIKDTSSGTDWNLKS